MKLKCIRHLINNEPYLVRWNLFEIWGWSLKIHLFLASDFDRNLHSHPFSFGGMILCNKYFEHTEKGKFLRKAWRPYWHGPNYFHRIELLPYEDDDEDAQGSKLMPVLTLFLTKKPRKEISWSFKCPNENKDYQDFIRDKGCD